MSYLNHLPKYKQFVIPYIVLVKSGIPYFKVNDDTKVEECIKERLCSVCGNPLESDMWMIGGPMSAFHPRGCYVDIPVHKECGIYSLVTCPYMAHTQYIVKPGTVSKLQGKLEDIMLVDPTIDSNRLPYFVFCKISDYKVVRKPPYERFIYPDKPYIEVEYWKDGTQIDEKTIKQFKL